MSLLQTALAIPGGIADTHTRPDPQAHPQPQPPPRACIICTETDQTQLVRPCICHSDYCRDCLVDMFVGATNDNTRMPPRCCQFLQIHTASALSDEAASAYRRRFEEWITLNKTYCPSPSCSAFLPERILPSTETTTQITLQSVLTDVLGSVTESPSARFFRGELPITELPGYTTVVTRPMDLSIIQDSIPRYKRTSEMTTDMMLIVKNAKQYNGAGHPIGRTADQLFESYMSQLSAATDKLLALVAGPQASDYFPCPTCHIAICVKCRQIEHSGKPCDSTSRDHELAMLEQFGYKRCPLCKHAVKKMFGCSHMQCICGAHWCWGCQKSTSLCDGACNDYGNDLDSEDELDDEDDIATSDISDMDHEGPLDAGVAVELAKLEGRSAPAQAPPTHAPAQAPPTHAPAVQAPPVQAPAVQLPAIQPPDPAARPPTQRRDDRIINLDAGGARRWAETEFDFGEEPDEEFYVQPWSCRHNFKDFIVATDEYSHGDLTKMECNRCFTKVSPRPPAKAPPKQKACPGKTKAPAVLHSAQDKDGIRGERHAMECEWCRMVVCGTCQACLDKTNAGKID